MGQKSDPKAVTLTELRTTTRSLTAWRTGALARLARKQVERVQRRSGTRPAIEDIIPPSKRNRHG